jgi:ketol-acid reductoisomerase
LLALAKGVGSTRVGFVEVEYDSETEGDSFEEQVLYGGTIALMWAVFETWLPTANPRISRTRSRSARSGP